MNIVFSSQFKKNLKTLPKKIQDKFFNSLEKFSNDIFDSSLKNHKLHGIYKNHRSINITGDIRAVYEQIDSKTYLFIAIGTHSKLYK